MTANKILFFIKGRSDSLSCVKPLIHYLTEQLFLYRGDLDNFSVITVCVCNFLKKEIGKKTSS